MTAPSPDADSRLYPDWNGNPVEFNTNISYKCERGRKFNDDFDQTVVNATCLPENKWTKPLDGEWPKCNESKLSTLNRGFCEAALTK